ncbi:MAG: chromosome segregation protein SMC [Candidatus Odinarchaeia archaeon]
MVFIKKLEMKGFKSFGKEKVSLSFPKGFTVIVGPNGSGKSNILDALCFVLGHLSAKTMRASAFTDLIYKPQKNQKAIGSATVTLHLDNSDRGIQIDSSTVVISRTIDTEGKGVYQLNGKRVTRTQILDLLSLAGIFPDGYNIVLQGQLAQMISMTPLERRNLIEKIAGITSYDEKKEKAKAELDKANNNLSQIEVLLDEIKNTKEKLQKDKEDAEKWMALSKQIQDLEASILFHEINSLKEKKEAAKERLKEKESRLEELQQQLKENKEIKTKYQEEIQQLDTQITAIRNTKLSQIHQSITDKRAEHSRISSDINYQEKTLTDALEQLNSLKNKLTEYSEMKEKYTSKLEENYRERDSLNIEIEELNTKINEVSASISNIDSGFEEFASNFKTIKDQLEKEENELNTLIIKNQKNDSDIEILTSKITNLEGLIQEILEGSRNILNQKDSLTKKIELLNNEINELTVQKEQLLSEIKQYETQINELINEIQYKKELLIEIKTRVRALKDSHDRITPRKQVLTALLELKNNKKIDGIYGTISELGVVKSEHLKALEAAAGGRLDYLIVKDQNTAAQCIAYLKNKKLGRAFFLPLDQLNPSVIKFEHNSAKYALELIKFEEKYRKAFEFVFGKTYVFDTLKEAMAQKERKIQKVTLDGDLIESNGLMVGGYYHPLSKFTVEEEQRIPQLIKEIKNLEEKLTQLKTERNIKVSKENQIVEEINKKQKEHSRLLGELNVLEPQLNELESSIKNYTDKIDSLKPLLTEKNNQKREFSNIIEEKQKIIENLRSEYEKLSKQLERSEAVKLNRQLKEIDKERTEKLTLLRELDQEITKLETNIKSNIMPTIEELKPAIKNLEKQIPKLRNTLNENKKKITALNKKLEELTKEKNETYNTISKLEEDRKQLMNEINSITDKITSIEKEINSLNMGIARMVANQESLESKLNDLIAISKECDIDPNQLPEVSDVERIKEQIRQLKEERTLLEPVNQKAIQEFEDVKQRFDDLNSRKIKLYKERQVILEFMDQIEQEKTKVFMKTYRAIDDNFNKIFSRLSVGGEAHLDLENKIHPFLGGVRIKAKPSGKEISYLESMSGGEKALTALALIFAIQQYQPAPFYILDEIDDALDLSNVVKVAELIKEFSKFSQFIVITLRDITMARADCLFGVTQSNGISKVVSVKLEEVAKYIER